MVQLSREGRTEELSRRWGELCRIRACISTGGSGELERLFSICLLVLTPDLKPKRDVLVGKQVTTSRLSTACLLKTNLFSLQVNISRGFTSINICFVGQ